MPTHNVGSEAGPDVAPHVAPDEDGGEDQGGRPDPARAARSGRSRWLLVAAVVGVAVLAALAWWQSRPRVDDPSVAATEMAATWSAQGLGEVDFAGPGSATGGPATDELTSLLGGLGEEVSTDVSVVSTTVDPDDPLHATTELDVTWHLAGDRDWQVATSANLVRGPDELSWSVVWDPSLVHPEVRAGDRLEVRRESGDRGRIMDTSGNVLVGPQRVTEVGLHPARIEDLDGVITAIVSVLDSRLDVQLDPAAIRADVAAADPDHFVPVITLRNDDYQQVEPVIYPLVGTTFRDAEEFVGPSSGFARFTLGSVGEVTAEQLEEQPDRWEPGDIAGRSGIQAAQDDVLSGTTGWSVVAERDDEADLVLAEVVPVAGNDVTVTLQTQVQLAAEAAIAETGHATSMVAMRASTGEVLAMANSPEATFDIARLGQLPPGSVFKVVTTTAMMQELGVTPDTPVGCPNSIQAGGRTISNAGSLALGDTVFAQAFANSCNTSFIDLSRDLSPTALQTAAAQLGLGGEWNLGVGSFSGDVPENTDARDLALASFGQGRTLVNPLDMATVMASVAAGQAVTPTLVVDTGSGAAGAGSDQADAAVSPLPSEVAATLQDLTRLVVTDGSGRALADAPGAPVHGKTGTAEYTNADGDLAKHVWFAGYRGDLAFAAVVTATTEGSGGGTAAPLIATFLDSLE